MSGPFIAAGAGAGGAAAGAAGAAAAADASAGGAAAGGSAFCCAIFCCRRDDRVGGILEENKVKNLESRRHYLRPNSEAHTMASSLLTTKQFSTAAAVRSSNKCRTTRKSHRSVVRVEQYCATHKQQQIFSRFVSSNSALVVCV
jgi:hypothetical protein